jgi:TPR repeat protein
MLEDRPVPRDSLAPAEADRPTQSVAAIPSRPGSRATKLLVRGQKAEQSGDISGARRLYASAAQQGIAAAARDLGRLYDPAYLKQTALGGIDPDPILARHWYEQAVTMGDVEAGPLLDALALR